MPGSDGPWPEIEKCQLYRRSRNAFGPSRGLALRSVGLGLGRMPLARGSLHPLRLEVRGEVLVGIFLEIEHATARAEVVLLPVMLDAEARGLGVDFHSAHGIDLGCHASILPPMSQQRRPRGKPTEDRKLLRPGPYADTTFLDSDAWRALRIMGEFVEGFDSLASLGPAISIFGSARVDQDDRYAKAAEELAGKLAHHGITVITGGGPGVMEAANRGAAQAGGVSVGLGIELPHEQETNPWCNLVLNFRYFFARKTMFVKYAQGFVIFPGGYGTLDELFESLVLVQTGKIDHFPVILYGKRYWQGLLDWLSDEVAQKHMIAAGDLKLLRMTDDTDEALEWIIEAFASAEEARIEAEASPASAEQAVAAQERSHQRTTQPD